MSILQLLVSLTHIEGCQYYNIYETHLVFLQYCVKMAAILAAILDICHTETRPNACITTFQSYIHHITITFLILK